MVSSLLILTSCSKCPEPTTEYITKYEYVDVPIKCTTPNVSCSVDANSSYTDVVNELIICIYELKKANEVCK